MGLVAVWLVVVGIAGLWVGLTAGCLCEVCMTIISAAFYWGVAEIVGVAGYMPVGGAACAVRVVIVVLLAAIHLSLICCYCTYLSLSLRSLWAQ